MSNKQNFPKCFCSLELEIESFLQDLFYVVKDHIHAQFKAFLNIFWN